MFLEFSWLNLLYLFTVTHITILTVTIYLHRCVAHRALTMNRWLEHFFRFWSWLTTGQNTKEWAAVHRKHHAFCEQKGDPHSPKIYGIFTVLFMGMLLYRAEAKNPETIARYGKFTPDDRIENFYRRFPSVGLFFMFVLVIFLFGWHGLWMYVVQILWIPFWAAGVINGMGHYFGYRKFNTDDNSRNLFPLGILIGGEELHNNHHAYPTSAKFSTKWYEADIGWGWIKLFNFFGLVKIKKDINLPTFNKRAHVDAMDTLKIFLSHKSMILNLFEKTTKKEVKQHLYNVKIHDQKPDCQQIKQLLHVFYNYPKNLSTHEIGLLKRIIEHNYLNKIYLCKQKILLIWDSKEKNASELILDLMNASSDMEDSSIESLKKFSKNIKTLSYVR